MARQARLFIPDCPMLLALQGLAGQRVFKTREAFALFHRLLPESAQAEGVALHAYCLVPDSVMLLLSAGEANQAGRFVQHLNRHFSPAVRALQTIEYNALWEARFKSTVVQPGPRALKACLYVEQLAIRQAGAHDLATYPWSSFAAHAGVVNEPWLSDLPLYWQLGNTPFERQTRYRQFSEHGLGQDEQIELQACLNKGWLWSDDAFCAQVQDLANRPVRPRPRGRPSSKSNNCTA
ncbi:transposase [Limnobacter sp.]|uniref:transposase n=1 Tax=Limnobacter sp. TaxID=2003368 RepID=UPI0035153B81